MIIVSGSMAFGRDLTMGEGKIEFYIPDTWKNEMQSGIISSESPDGGVAVVFTLLRNEQLNDALAEAEASIVDAVGPLSPNGEVLEFTVNGMPATMQKGSAQNGQTSVSLTMVLTPVGRWLMIMYMGNKTQEAFWRKDLNEILNSVKPLN
jgi:hypothetical protein